MGLDEIVRLLALHKQRATYGAVGGVLYGENPGAGQQCGNLLARRPRNPHHFWVVRKSDGLTSGYTRDQMDVSVYRRQGTVIEEADGLESWLRSHR